MIPVPHGPGRLLRKYEFERLLFSGPIRDRRGSLAGNQLLRASGSSADGRPAFRAARFGKPEQRIRAHGAKATSATDGHAGFGNQAGQNRNEREQSRQTGDPTAHGDNGLKSILKV